MAAPVLVSHSKEVSDSFSDASFVPSNVGDSLTGDLLIHFGVTKENSGGDKAILPAGWTSLVDLAIASGGRAYLGYKMAAGAAEAATLTFGNPTAHNVAHWSQYLVLRGNGVDPFADSATYRANISPSDDNTNPLTIPQISYFEDWLVLAFFFGESLINPINVSAFPVGMTSVDEAKNGSVAVIGANAALAQMTVVADGETIGLFWNADQSGDSFFHSYNYVLSFGDDPAGGGAPGGSAAMASAYV